MTSLFGFSLCLWAVYLPQEDPGVTLRSPGISNHSVLDKATSGYTEAVHQAMKSQNLQSERYNEGIWKRSENYNLCIPFTAL